MPWLPNPASTDIVLAILDAAARGTFTLLAAALATAGMRASPAALRQMIWAAALAALVALPAASAVIPHWSFPLLRVSEWLSLGVETISVAPQSGARIGADPSSVGLEPIGPASARAAWTHLRPWLTWAWIAGVMVVLLRLGLGLWGRARLRRTACRVHGPGWTELLQELSQRLRIRRPLALLLGAPGTIPATWGLLRPVVFLPAEAEHWSVERRRSVLLHELAHVARVDALTQLGAQLALACFWFHPLVWVALHRLRIETEHACDDLVLRSGIRAPRYAEDLLEIVRSAGGPRRGALVLPIARGSGIERRILAILDDSIPRSLHCRAHAALVGIATALLVVPLASVRLQAEAMGSPGGHSPPPMLGNHSVWPVSAAGTGMPSSPAIPPPFNGCPGIPRATSVGSVPASDDLYVWIGVDGCTESVRVGDVILSPDGTRIERISEGGQLVVQQIREGVTYRVRFAVRAGVLDGSFSVNKVPRPVAEGASWLASIRWPRTAPGWLPGQTHRARSHPGT